MKTEILCFPGEPFEREKRQLYIDPAIGGCSMKISWSCHRDGETETSRGFCRAACQRAMAEWGAQPSPPMPQMRQPHSVQQPALQCRNLFRVCWDIYCNMITICMDNCPTGCHWTILKYGLSAQQRNCKWTPFFFYIPFVPETFLSGEIILMMSVGKD